MGKGTRREGWERTAVARRILILVLILASTALASVYMAGVLPHRGSSWLELAIVVVFAALFAWVSIGFWEAISGLFILMRGRDRFSLARASEGTGTLEGTGARTAILIPVANEDMDRVGAGLRATYLSLERTGQLSHFDFFILLKRLNTGGWNTRDHIHLAGLQRL